MKISKVNHVRTGVTFSRGGNGGGIMYFCPAKDTALRNIDEQITDVFEKSRRAYNPFNSCDDKSDKEKEIIMRLNKLI